VSDPIEVLQRFDPLGARGARDAPSGARRYLLLDVFTRTPLQGNQLAVFLDGRGLAGELMQRIARELNLSETVFLLPPLAGGEVRVRIFTPASELPFAGHPVLGAATVTGAALERESLVLETGMGEVPVSVRPEHARAAFGRMQQPIPSWRPFARELELLRALGVDRSQLPVEVYDNGPHHVYVTLESEAAVAALAPDLRALAELGEIGVSCLAGAGTRWKTRMFAPALGVAEDPATGSAAGPLSVHLARHGLVPFGQEIEIRQGEEIGRPSLLYARAEGSRERLLVVEVAGAAVIVADGELAL
jgi:trans-2,3-dihydro-3-hydroxyanthranilate isomerase